MKTFLQAISFLTILPVWHPSLSEEKELARSMAFFPLVGLIVGLILTLGYYLFSLFFSGALVLWLTIGLLAVLTRGLHLDGFADTVDGLGSGGPRERVLEVMRDSRIGAFGVISLILLIGAKYFALDQIPRATIPYAIILMAVMGRNAMVMVCYRSPYARSSGGLAKSFVENLNAREVLISSALTLGIAILLMGVKGIAILLGIALFSLGYRLFFLKKLGGVTGDILGAANELAELLCLLFVVILEPIRL